MKIDPRFTLKALMTWEGREGWGYRFTLFVDGVKSAFIFQEGSGGDTGFTWLPDSERAKAIWEYAVSSSPPVPAEGGLPEMPMHGDILAEELMNAHRVEAQQRRWCRTKTVFRLKGDAADTWRILKCPWGDGANGYLIGQYGSQIEEILNEKFQEKPCISSKTGKR